MQTRFVTKVEPKNGSIIIQREKRESAGGILLADWRGQNDKLRVLAIAEDVKQCEPGDYIILGPNAMATELDPFDDSIEIIANADDRIIAVVEYAEEEDHPLILAPGTVLQ